ncbi:unnamed protein product [Aphanomyces euteiches]|uniref:Alpha/beta hydrolase fold-3 domain-containing protein n=1 Tax=Aphanomyces euteiches TaxID=100861 RepID=A0A6G0X2K4_9STRA|nr:hypothetical protein Ae201684_009010 [Aphanomyces euteiches]
MADGHSKATPPTAKEPYSLSFLQAMGYLVYLTITTPIKRLVGGKPLVDGWSIRTEVVTKFLAFMMSADPASSTKIMTTLSSLGPKTSWPPLQTDKFEAIWYGDGLNDDACDAIVLYIHGGGFVLGRADMNAKAIVGLLSTAKAEHNKTLLGLGLDYKLAPEHKFPSQLHEALAAYEYLTTQSSKPILLVGDSAGGNLVLSLLLALKQPENKHLRRPAAAVMVSPWCQLDYETIAASYTKNRDTDFVGADNLSHCARAYIGTASAKDPMVSPILGDFRGCCPMLIHYGGKEVFEDDIDILCERLKEQQVDVTAVKNPLAPHNTAIMTDLYGDMALSGSQVIAAFLAKHA